MEISRAVQCDGSKAEKVLQRDHRHGNCAISGKTCNGDTGASVNMDTLSVSSYLKGLFFCNRYSMGPMPTPKHFFGLELKHYKSIEVMQTL